MRSFSARLHRAAPCHEAGVLPTRDLLAQLPLIRLKENRARHTRAPPRCSDRSHRPTGVKHSVERG